MGEMGELKGENMKGDVEGKLEEGRVEMKWGVE